MLHITVMIAATFCFGCISAAVRSHFKGSGPMPMGMLVISTLSMTGYATFLILASRHGSCGLWQDALAAIVLVVANTLFFWTVRTTASRPPTLAYATDIPCFLHDEGPFRHVRHPFYAAYILFWLGTAIGAGGWIAWLVPCVLAAIYAHAASCEERKFAGSDVALAYGSYKNQTGMFIPKLVPFFERSARAI